MQNIANRFYKPCLERAKLRRRRFHDLRHYATLMIENGESLAYVKEQLGHTIKTSVDVYGHIKPGMNRNSVNRLPGARKESVFGLRGNGEVVFFVPKTRNLSATSRNASKGIIF